MDPIYIYDYIKIVSLSLHCILLVQKASDFQIAVALQEDEGVQN